VRLAKTKSGVGSPASTAWIRAARSEYVRSVAADAVRPSARPKRSAPITAAAAVLLGASALTAVQSTAKRESL